MPISEMSFTCAQLFLMKSLHLIVKNHVGCHLVCLVLTADLINHVRDTLAGCGSSHMCGDQPVDQVLQASDVLNAAMESGAVVTWTVAGADMVTGGVGGVVVTAEVGSVILITSAWEF